MHGRGGNDTYVVDNPGDVVYEESGDGDDSVVSSISYALGAEVEGLELTGIGNIDGIGNDLDNWISGNAGNNVLTGGGGNDWFGIDSAGIDTLDGGIGSDTYAIWADATGTKIISSADSTPGKTDTLYLDFDPLTTTVGRAGLDLQFSFAGSTATVIVRNYFATSGRDADRTLRIYRRNGMDTGRYRRPGCPLQPMVTTISWALPPTTRFPRWAATTS